MKHRSMTLGRLESELRADDLLVSEAASDTVFTGVTDDSRSVKQGDLFCAWAGSSLDAHAYVPAAVSAGAAAVMVERHVPEATVPQIVVRNGRRAAAIAASVFFDMPERSLRLAGVTGTNGKTTSVWVLRHMLSQREPTASLGTLGAILDDGSTLPGSEELTTPGPVQLARTLRLFVDRGVRNVAMEVSSHALEQGRVHTLEFDVAVFTNLSRDHLDYHGTIETYLGVKRSLVDLLSDDGCAVINADDSAWNGLAERAPRSITFGIDNAADVMGRDMRLGATGSKFTLQTPDVGEPVNLPLPGRFNVENVLGAVGACLAMGLSSQEAAAAVGTIPQVPGRLERISDVPCPVLRDYAHTPDALERVLGTLRPLTAGRLIVLFGAGGDRDRGKRPQMGAIAERYADIAIVTSDNPRTEDPDSIIDEIEAGMTRDHVRITDRREAIRYALRTAEPDDVIVLAGKGHETYQVIGTEKQPFDERVIVAQALRGAA